MHMKFKKFNGILSSTLFFSDKYEKMKKTAKKIDKISNNMPYFLIKRYYFKVFNYKTNSLFF